MRDVRVRPRTMRPILAIRSVWVDRLGPVLKTLRTFAHRTTLPQNRRQILTAKISVAIATLALAVSAGSAIATFYLQGQTLKISTETNGRLGIANLCFTWAGYVEDLRAKKVPLKEIDRRVAYFVPRFEKEDAAVARGGASLRRGCGSAQGMFTRRASQR